ncbi:hypothetical protein H7691_08495 [Stenotrophomonas sp. CW117]|uniref:hypothetical protein n=1 Tax=Stenotrophomonas TaxID=40323 RepID=UPI00070359D3|nr:MULTISPECIES: hypothetical protein [Stenotrophomonas]KRG84310.1 hypothetical protein ABB33_11845 [Stenotrophomonas acidaminiphila]QOG00127.1 hypothetical protein H7691_08495 [Stenotrophomonas sp. CW117]
MTTHPTKEAYYEAEGVPQAIALFDELHSRVNHGVNMAISLDQLRKRLDKLPDDTLIPSALAALWLRLSQREERARRKIEPPPNPFTQVGAAKKARKKDILEWDAAWRLKKMVATGVQDMQLSGAETTNKAAATLLRKLQWVIARGEVLGWIEQLPEEVVTDIPVSQWEIKPMPLRDALLRKWRDPQEQSLWVKRYKAANRLLEAEVERSALAAVAKPKKDKPTPPRPI